MLAAASASQAAVSFVSFGLPAIGPELRREFGLTLPELGAVLTAVLLGSGLSLIAAGIVVDRFGTRAAMLGGTALGAGGLAVAAAAGSKQMLFAALLLSGVGAAVVPVAGAGALFRVYPPSRRGFALGVRQMSVPLGGALAALAVPVLEHAGGAGLALAVAAVGVAATGVLFAFVPGPAPHRSGRSARQPLRSIWHAHGMQRLLVVAGLYIVVLQAVLTFLVPAARAAGLSALAAGSAFFVLNLTAMAARIVWGRIADRDEGTRRTRTLTEIGAVAAVGALAFAVALHAGTTLVLAATVLFGFGALGWNAIVYVSAGERTPPDLAARSVAVAATIVFLLSAVSTPLLGALAARAGWDAFWVATGAIAAAGALVAASLPAALAR